MAKKTKTEAADSAPDTNNAFAPQAETPAAPAPAAVNAGDLEGDVSDTKPAAEPAADPDAKPEEPAAPAGKTAAELRSADPFQLSPEEIAADLAAIGDIDAERQKITLEYGDFILWREQKIKSMDEERATLLDRKRRFEERYAELGERRRLLLAALKKHEADVEIAAERAKSDAAYHAEQARQKAARELQERKDRMGEAELRQLREERQRALAVAR